MRKFVNAQTRFPSALADPFLDTTLSPLWTQRTPVYSSCNSSKAAQSTVPVSVAHLCLARTTFLVSWTRATAASLCEVYVYFCSRPKPRTGIRTSVYVDYECTLLLAYLYCSIFEVAPLA